MNDVFLNTDWADLHVIARNEAMTCKSGISVKKKLNNFCNDESTATDVY